MFVYDAKYQPKLSNSCRWGLTRAPTGLVEELQQKIRDNIDHAAMEKKIDVIETEMGARPLCKYKQILSKRATINAIISIGLLMMMLMMMMILIKSAM